MKKKNISQWIPGITLELISVVSCIIYALTDASNKLVYLELLGASLAPFLFPVYNMLTKKPLPMILSIITAVFVFLTCNLVIACNFYNKIICWDLLMHGTFGFVCCLILFVMLIRWNGSKLNPVGFMIIIFVFTMGVAALWEVWEYLADSITGGDAQRVMESIAQGKSPVADTMEDIIVSMAGCAIFYITLIIDKFVNHKIYSKLCEFSGFEK